jgi:hypothetical protein
MPAQIYRTTMTDRLQKEDILKAEPNGRLALLIIASIGLPAATK